MNWTQIKCILSLLAIAGLAFFLLETRAFRHSMLQRRILRAGHELATTTNADRIVRIDAALQRELATFLVATARVTQILSGDVAAPFGDGQASGCVILSNADGKQLGIRLRDGGGDQVEAIGFWFPAVGGDPPPAPPGDVPGTGGEGNKGRSNPGRRLADSPCPGLFSGRPFRTGASARSTPLN